jgi:hypothetical protein
MERRTVICRDIFSPENGGNTNPINVSTLIKKQGKMMVMT